jgi:hypothetical protein
MAFGLILGSAAIAAALAFGLGGRDAAARVLERYDLESGPPRRVPPPKRIRNSPPSGEPDDLPPLV